MHSSTKFSSAPTDAGIISGLVGAVNKMSLRFWYAINNIIKKWLHFIKIELLT